MYTIQSLADFFGMNLLQQITTPYIQAPQLAIGQNDEKKQDLQHF